MSSAHVLHPTIARAEDIALLYLLHSVPTQPSSNRSVNLPVCQDYPLSFRKEGELTSTLAFLSSTKNDPDHIPAVCIEQNRVALSIKVLLAVNKRGQNDGSAILKELKRSFENIIAILPQISEQNAHSNVEYQIFTAIVNMCSQRILCRLRFLPNTRNKPKQPVREVLQEAISSFEHLGTQGLAELSEVAMLFTENAKHVVRLAGSWIKHQTLPQLRELVEGFYRLQKMGDLKALLATIPNGVMSPSARTNLLNIIRKVARYREAAQFLYRTAKRYRLVRHMEVTLATLPEGSFEQITIGKYAPRLALAISRMSAVHQQPEASYICRLLKTTESQANETFAAQTKRTMTQAKVHAEIQLLYHCELNKMELPPRILCSSKDACFLCNAFIAMHGKMYTPRYHGRLYPGWRLPLSPILKVTEQKFNSLLEDQVRSSLSTLVSRRQKTVYPDPNESTLFTLAGSASSIHNSMLSRAVEEEVEAAQVRTSDERVQKGSSITALSVRSFSVASGDMQSANCIRDENQTTVGTESCAKLLPLNNTASSPVLGDSHSTRSLSPTEIDGDYIELAQGRTLSRNLLAGNKSPLYTVGSFETQIEYPLEETAGFSDATPTGLRCGIEWVRLGEAHRLYEHQAKSIIDAGALRGELTYELDNQNCLFIGSRDALVRITLHMKPSQLGD